MQQSYLGLVYLCLSALAALRVNPACEENVMKKRVLILFFNFNPAPPCINRGVFLPGSALRQPELLKTTSKEKKNNQTNWRGDGVAFLLFLLTSIQVTISAHGFVPPL